MSKIWLRSYPGPDCKNLGFGVPSLTAADNPCPQLQPFLVLTPLWYAMQKNKRLTPPSCLQHDNAEEDKTCFKWKVVQRGNKDIHCTVSKRYINRLGYSYNFFRFLKWKRCNSVALLKTLCSRLPGHTTGSGAALLTHQHFSAKFK